MSVCVCVCVCVCVRVCVCVQWDGQILSWVCVVSVVSLRFTTLPLSILKFQIVDLKKKKIIKKKDRDVKRDVERLSLAVFHESVKNMNIPTSVEEM